MKKATYFIVILFAVGLPLLAMAESAPTPYIEGDPITLDAIKGLVQQIVNTIITISSIVVVGYFIYAGMTMLTAGDDTAKFAKGKKMLYNAIIGAAVVFGVGVILSTVSRFATSGRIN